MQQNDYLKHLADIRAIMQRSSQFDYLSGWAGIAAGIYALIGVCIAQFQYGLQQSLWNSTLPGGSLPDYSVVYLIIASCVFLFAFATACYFSIKKAQQAKQAIWNALTRKVLFHISIPMLIGALVIFKLSINDAVAYVPGLMLLFYGLGLISSSHFTHSIVRKLGYVQLVMGLFALFVLNLSMVFWVLGFGFAHIVYGVQLLRRRNS